MVVLYSSCRGGVRCTTCCVSSTLLFSSLFSHLIYFVIFVHNTQPPPDNTRVCLHILEKFDLSWIHFSLFNNQRQQGRMKRLIDLCNKTNDGETP